MKPNLDLIVILAVLITTASCKSKSQKDAEDYMNKVEKAVKENSPATDEKTNASTEPVSPDMENIIGEWELVGSIVDTNDNLQIDDEERKNLTAPGYKNYMKLNRDGSGLFTVAQMEGRYEIKTDESNGRKVMTWYDNANGPHRIGSVMKVTKDELTIKEPGGSGLFLWKRL
jgi:hypothetical protein